MHTEYCTYQGCDRHFTKKNKALAKQAIQMHIDRKHTLRIQTPSGPRNSNGHTGVITASPPTTTTEMAVALPTRTRPMRGSAGKGGGGSHLSPQEVMAVVEFIRAHADEFTTKTGCFKAALAASGLTGRIMPSFTTVTRYYGRATRAEQPRTKRSYRKHQAAAPAPVAQKTINFCSYCGQSIKAQALGSVIAERILAGAVVTIDGEKVEYAR